MGVCYSRTKSFRAKRSRTQPALGAVSEQSSRQAYGGNAYELVGQLGAGKTGTMKLMSNRKTKELVAAKFVQRIAGAGLSKNTEREIVNHRRLVHPNIIRFYEVFMTDDHLVIVMEYASGGSLEQRIGSSGPLPEEKARDLFMQLASALDYCHSRSIYHRDLRLQNLHLHGSHFEPQLKLTGFGYSKSAVLDSQPKTNVGSPVYTPPELLMYTRNEGSAYDGGSNDVWSAGIILFYMLTGNMPFEDKATPGALNRKVMQKIVNVEYDFPPNVELSRECKDLVGRIFTKDPNERIRTSEMRRHPWLAGTSMAVEDDVSQSQQSELEIHQIVEKARRRRSAKYAAAGKPKPDVASPEKHEQMNGERRRSHSAANGVNGSLLADNKPPSRKSGAHELGIAEVPGQKSLPRSRSRR